MPTPDLRALFARYDIAVYDCSWNSVRRYEQAILAATGAAIHQGSARLARNPDQLTLEQQTEEMSE